MNYNLPGTRVLNLDRRFECRFYYIDWTEIQFGVNIGLNGPNLSIFFPCGFFRIGWIGICISRKDWERWFRGSSLSEKI